MLTSATAKLTFPQTSLTGIGVIKAAKFAKSSAVDLILAVAVDATASGLSSCPNGVEYMSLSRKL